MGAWISLNQFKYFKKQIKGFIGIGSAPEFLDKTNVEEAQKIKKRNNFRKGICIIKSNPNNGKYQYPITYQLKDGKKTKSYQKKN